MGSRAAEQFQGNFREEMQNLKMSREQFNSARRSGPMTVQDQNTLPQLPAGGRKTMPGPRGNMVQQPLYQTDQGVARRGHHTARPASSAAPGAAGKSGTIEEEYIKNLQNQIYFLELEMRFLKEKGGNRTARTGTIGEPESLDGYLDQLKDKYSNVEADYRDKWERLEREKEEAEIRASRAEDKCQRMEEEKRGNDERVQSELDKFKVALEEKTKRIVRLEEDVKAALYTAERESQQCKRHMDLHEKDKKTFAEAEAEVTKLRILLDAKAKEEAQEREAVEMEKRDLVQKEKEIRDLSEQLRAANTANAALQKENTHHRHTAEKAQRDMIKLKTERDEAVTTKGNLIAQISDLSDRLSAANTQAKESFFEIEKLKQFKEKKEAERRHANVQEVAYIFIQKWHRRKLDKYRAEVKRQDETREELALELAKAKKAAEDMKREKEAVELRMESMENQINEQKEDLSMAKGENAVVEANRIHVEELIAHREQRLEALEAENSDLRATNKQYMKKIKLQSIVDDLNTDEFKRMMHTNSNVAHKVEELLHVLKD